MTLPPLIPDVARLVSAYLRGVPEVAALAEDRVYTAFPKQVGELPFVLVTRTGGEPVVAFPLVLEQAFIQLDAYGGTQAAAYQLVATCRAALSVLRGEQPDGLGNVTDAVAAANRYLPDETWQPPRPRYVSDLLITVKPASVVLAGRA